MARRLLTMFVNEQASTAMEYALIAAIVAMVAVIGFSAIGTDVASMFTTIAAEFTP